MEEAAHVEKRKIFALCIYGVNELGTFGRDPAVNVGRVPVLGRETFPGFRAPFAAQRTVAGRLSALAATIRSIAASVPQVFAEKELF